MIRRNRRLKLTVVLAGVFVFALLPSRLVARDLQTAENILLYQRDSGGWPKNYDRNQAPTEAQRRDILNDKSKCDAMIDNGATHTEIRLLAAAFDQTRDARFQQAALRGIRYLTTDLLQPRRYSQAHFGRDLPRTPHRLLVARPLRPRPARRGSAPLAARITRRTAESNPPINDIS